MHHHWQDYVLSVGALVFSLALLPSVFSHHKPALWTSLLTATVLIIYIFVYASLSLWYTTCMVALNGFMWLILAAQKALQQSSAKKSNNN
jgi:membrane glycosyltransferase